MNSPASTCLAINGERLLQRIAQLAQIGAIDGGGVCRLALTDEDKAGRDQVVSWMRDLGMSVEIDQIGNIIGTRAGRLDVAPVMTGSHIDTVRTGGRYDGNLGVLAGLEVVASLNDADVQLDRPLQVVAFTNEEGARFAPDMMGSLVFQGGLSLQEALDTVGIDGSTVRENLERIGYAGSVPCGQPDVHAYMELHIEQGPVLEHESIDIGAVTGVQGICWLEFEVQGVSNHAGTTPMHLRHDAGVVAQQIGSFVRQLTERYGPPQLGTVGRCELFPNLVNVIPSKAVFTVDLRNVDKASLDQAEQEVLDFARQAAEREGVQIKHRHLARFDPVQFDERLISKVEQHAKALGCSVKRMPSGAGHDAQMLARSCPTGMIFVPSVRGLSHNPAEFTHDKDLIAGCSILLSTLVELARE